MRGGGRLTHPYNTPPSPALTHSLLPILISHPSASSLFNTAKMELLSLYTLLLALLAFSAYCISLAVYRLYFSPIAKFPGPKLAALTLWYEFYYDVVQRGRYTWKIAELHERYGLLFSLPASCMDIHVARANADVEAPSYESVLMNYISMNLSQASPDYKGRSAHP